MDSSVRCSGIYLVSQIEMLQHFNENIIRLKLNVQEVKKVANYCW